MHDGAPIGEALWAPGPATKRPRASKSKEVPGSSLRSVTATGPTSNVYVAARSTPDVSVPLGALNDVTFTPCRLPLASRTTAGPFGLAFTTACALCSWIWFLNL
mgnify:CR=1 FL=1